MKTICRTMLITVAGESIAFEAVKEPYPSEDQSRSA